MPTKAEALQLAAALQWKAADDELQRARVAELELRTAAIVVVFGTLSIGTTNRALADGSVLKGVVREKPKVDPKTIAAALAKLRAVGDAGVLLAERLVKWTPEASLAEIKKLTPKQWKLFAGAITLGQTGPSLELKPAD